MQVPSFGWLSAHRYEACQKSPQCQAKSFAAPPAGRSLQPYGLINHKNQISDISFYFEGYGNEGVDMNFYIDLYIIIIIYKSKLQEALKEGVVRIKLISDI